MQTQKLSEFPLPALSVFEKTKFFEPKKEKRGVNSKRNTLNCNLLFDIKILEKRSTILGDVLIDLFYKCRSMYFHVIIFQFSTVIFAKVR